MINEVSPWKLHSPVYKSRQHENSMHQNKISTSLYNGSPRVRIRRDAGRKGRLPMKRGQFVGGLESGFLIRPIRGERTPVNGAKLDSGNKRERERGGIEPALQVWGELPLVKEEGELSVEAFREKAEKKLLERETRGKK
ncbi:Uncharacterized protein TCM_025197 [Theobroma cacao]|uniref:Uncharacterized protein n=1 Tax=Theobroma cacao TaxID=3641 RepID=A0A061EYE6_THECC|nr:Uncharacterized protein TCM_025197 [Theobroma cacao]